MNRNTAIIRKISLFSGMLGPLTFVLGFMIQGWIRSPDYDAFAMHISALSLGTTGWIQIFIFMLTGIFLFAFALQVGKELKGEKRFLSGPIILIISSICFFFSGPFVMDPMFTPRESMSIHGIIHGLSGGIVFTLMPVTCYVFYGRFRMYPNWNKFKLWTLFFALVLTASLIFFTAVSKSEVLTLQFKSYLGLIQRIVIVPYMIWLFLFALLLYRKSK